MTTHKKSDLKIAKTFDTLPDGKYIAVLDNVKCDLANKYGARVNMTFKLPNRRLIWVDLKENPASTKGPLAGAWYTLKLLGVGTEVSDALGEEFTTQDFLEKSTEMIDEKLGHYFELELKTTTSQKNGKQYQNAYVVGESTESDFEAFQIPKAAKEDNLNKLFDDSDDFAAPF